MRRSGRSLTIVTQYDVELFQKIEALTGHKMEEYPAEQEAVLLLLERVGEAQRISTMQVTHLWLFHLITFVSCISASRGQHI